MIKNKDQMKTNLKKPKPAFAHHACSLGIAGMKYCKREGLESMDECETN